MAETETVAGRVSGKVAQIVEAIKGLSLLEAVELRKAIEAEFGVTAAPAMVAMGPAAGGIPGAGGGAAAAAVEEKTNFDVVLKSFSGDKIKVIKAVREVKSTLGLKEAKALVESLPQVVLEGVTKEEAEKVKAKLADASGEVELK